MAKVVQLDADDTRVGLGLTPLVAHGVLVPGVAVLAGEHPPFGIVTGPAILHVSGQRRGELVGKIDHALALALWGLESTSPPFSR
jgi:hypothetical protein